MLHSDVICIRRELEKVSVEAALQLSDGYTETMLTFANYVNTTDGEYAPFGLQVGADQEHQRLRSKANILKDNDDNLTGEDVREASRACSA